MRFDELSGIRYAVNCSILFTELPLLDRFDAVRAAGFGAVELWWPFATPEPADGEIDALVAAVDAAGVALVGLNFFAGDMAGGDRGVVCDPDQVGAFRANVEVAIGVGERLGCKQYNALYGNRPATTDVAAQDAVALDNLAFAARAAHEVGAGVLVEPLSGAPDYPLKSAADVVGVIERVEQRTGLSNTGMLADFYHLAVNGEDVEHVLDEHRRRVTHVQIADAPGRGEPGSGELALADQLAALHEGGYRGWVGLEYRPSVATADSFAWLAPAARSAS